MSFEIGIKGLAELKKRIAPALYRPRLLQTMQQITLMVASYVKTDELSGQVLHIRTHRLKSSIQGAAELKGSEIIGRIGTNLKYARIHEYGGTIRAINAPYLKFKIGNQWVQKKEVHIPARPFLVPAILKNEDRIVGMLEKTIALMLEGK